jgi:hypothetical protein
MLQAGMKDETANDDDGDSSTGKEAVPSAQDIQERLEDAIHLARTGQPEPSHLHAHGQPSSRTRSKVRGIGPGTNAAIDLDSTTSPSPGLRNRYNRSHMPSAMDERLRRFELAGVNSPMVKLRKLEADDPRAVEFREKLRIW